VSRSSPGSSPRRSGTPAFFNAAVKAPAADPDIGLEVFLFPYAPDGEDGPSLTGAPWDDAPLIVFRRYRGDLQLGRTQQTINELDTSQLEQAGGGALRPGAEIDMGDGVVVRFVELRRWVGFQVSSRPQLPWLLVASALLMAGLVPALYAYRRRLWVVAERPDRPGPYPRDRRGARLPAPPSVRGRARGRGPPAHRATLEAAPVDPDPPDGPAPHGGRSMSQDQLAELSRLLYSPVTLLLYAPASICTCTR
jgi:hypothetical protein